MSLQVWLPLNGDLHNQGLKDINIVSNNITFTSAGKIGQCANFDGSSSRIYINNMSLENTWSYGCWVNTPTSDSRGWESVIIFNNNGSDSDSQLAFWIHLKENRFESLANTQYNSTISYTNYYSSWHHFFATFDGSTLKSFIDGNIVNTKSITATKYTATNLTIGARCTNIAGSTFSSYFLGQINDIRIYDNCLSQKEVEEIAKGLVLHYKLDNAINSTISTLYQEVLYLEATGTLYINTGTDADSFDVDFQFNTQYSGNYLYSVVSSRTSSNTNIFGLSHWAGNLVPAPPNANLVAQDTERHIVKSGSLFDNTVIYDGTVSLTYSSYTPNTSNVYLFADNKGGTLQGRSSCKIYYIKLYKNGTLVRDMIPCYRISDNTPGMYDKVEGTFYTNNGTGNFNIGSNIYNINTIQDCSGYGNNGTLIGTATASLDTARYNSCTYFNASSAINCGRGGMVTDSITVNLWAKYTTFSNLVSCTEGGGWNLENNGGLTFPVYIDGGVGYVHIATASRPAVASFANNWHMFTGVYDRIGLLVKLYIDGELQGTGTVSSPNPIKYHATNVIWLNAEATGSNTAGTYGNSKLISDFRIYCTALTDAQIKELYNTSATVDNNGNIYTRELVEE